MSNTTSIFFKKRKEARKQFRKIKTKKELLEIWEEAENIVEDMYEDQIFNRVSASSAEAACIQRMEKIPGIIVSEKEVLADRPGRVHCVWGDNDLQAIENRREGGRPKTHHTVTLENDDFEELVFVVKRKQDMFTGLTWLDIKAFNETHDGRKEINIMNGEKVIIGFSLSLEE